MEGLELLNHVANQPEVLPFICPGFERVSLDRFFDNPKNIMLGDERGLLLFEYMRPGCFEGHYLLTNALRGQAAIGACHASLNAMFTHYGADAIFGFVPRQNRAASAVSCALGFTPHGTVTIRGLPFAMYVLRREDYEFHRRSGRRQRTADRG